MKTIVLILIIMILVSCTNELSIDEDKLLPHQLEFYRYFNNSSLCKKLEIYDSLMIETNYETFGDSVFELKYHKKITYHSTNKFKLDTGYYNLYRYVSWYIINNSPKYRNSNGITSFKKKGIVWSLYYDGHLEEIETLRKEFNCDTMDK